MHDPLIILLKLLLAVIFGGIVGWQREARDRPAGLRTHVLVCVGAAVYTLASLSFRGPGIDPGRVAAQVATGMGFLGAGTIIRHGNFVRGLTTAASLWTVAAIGLCIAIGGQLLWVAALATILVLMTLTLLRRLEQRLHHRSHLARITLAFRAGASPMPHVQERLTALGITIETIESAALGPDGVQELRLRVELTSDCNLAELPTKLSDLPSLLSLRCE